MKLMKERLVDLTVEQQHKVMRGNAERLSQFTPAEPATIDALR